MEQQDENATPARAPAQPAAANDDAARRRQMLDDWKQGKRPATTPTPAATPATVAPTPRTPVHAAPAKPSAAAAAAHTAPFARTTASFSAANALLATPREPVTPTAKLAQRVRSLAGQQNSPAVKLGQRVQALREMHNAHKQTQLDTLALAIDLPRILAAVSPPRRLFDDSASALSPSTSPAHEPAPIAAPAAPVARTTHLKPAAPTAPRLEGLYWLRVAGTGEKTLHYAVPRGRPLIRRAVAAGLFTLQTAADLVKTGEIEAARAVFACLEANSALQTSAHFWIARAYFEELHGDPQRVSALYDAARAAQATPAADLAQGLHWFHLRASECTKFDEPVLRVPPTSPVMDRAPVSRMLDFGEADLSPAGSVETVSPLGLLPALEGTLARLNLQDDIPVSADDLTGRVSLGGHFASNLSLDSQTPSPLKLSDDAARNVGEELTPRAVRKPAQTRRAHVESTQPLLETSRVRLASITPGRKMREALGMVDAADLASRGDEQALNPDVIVTPVRRSTRTPSRPRPDVLQPPTCEFDSISALRNTRFAYVPNPALSNPALMGSTPRPTSEGYATPRPARRTESDVDALASTFASQNKSGKRAPRVRLDALLWSTLDSDASAPQPPSDKEA